MKNKDCFQLVIIRLPTTIFTLIFLLFVSSFAILFQVKRRAMRTSYLFVTHIALFVIHIALEDFPILLSTSIYSETLAIRLIFLTE